jgi:hypothetical protein
VADQVAEVLRVVVQAEPALKVKVLLEPVLFMRLVEVVAAKVPPALTQMAEPAMLG